MSEAQFLFNFISFFHSSLPQNRADATPLFSLSISSTCDNLYSQISKILIFLIEFAAYFSLFQNGNHSWRRRIVDSQSVEKWQNSKRGKF